MTFYIIFEKIKYEESFNYITRTHAHTHTYTYIRTHRYIHAETL